MEEGYVDPDFYEHNLGGPLQWQEEDALMPDLNFGSLDKDEREIKKLIDETDSRLEEIKNLPIMWFVSDSNLVTEFENGISLLRFLREKHSEVSGELEEEAEEQGYEEMIPSSSRMTGKPGQFVGHQLSRHNKYRGGYE